MKCHVAVQQLKYHNLVLWRWRLATNVSDPGSHDLNCLEGSPFDTVQVRVLQQQDSPALANRSTESASNSMCATALKAQNLASSLCGPTYHNHLTGLLNGAYLHDMTQATRLTDIKIWYHTEHAGHILSTSIQIAGYTWYGSNLCWGCQEYIKRLPPCLFAKPLHPVSQTKTFLWKDCHCDCNLLTCHRLFVFINFGLPLAEALTVLKSQDSDGWNVCLQCLLLNDPSCLMWGHGSGSGRWGS